MNGLKQKINFYLAIVLVLMMGLLAVLFIKNSINQPGLKIGRGAVITEEE